MRLLSLALATAIVVSCTPLSAQQVQEKKSSFVGRVLSGFFGSSKTKTVKAQPAVAVRTVGGQTVESVDDESTHQQTALIKCVNAENQTLQVNSFCLNGDGELLAGCGSGPGEIRVYDADGNFQRSWEVPVKPEAVNTAPDDTVLVAGQGRLFQFTPEGEKIREAKAPHAEAVTNDASAIRKQVVEQGKQQAKAYEQQVEIYDKQIARLKEKGEDNLSTAEQNQLRSFEQIRARMMQMRDRVAGAKMSDAQIDAQVRAMTSRKMKMSSISSDGNHVFVAAPAMVGYGFDVWRLDQQLAAAEKIITGLRGCCGQMDVQACDNGVFVAENSRHRVVRYAADGEQILTWGKRDRKGVDGFTSCCNPMNVAFGPKGDVYTAESNTGRIKRFNTDGEFLSYVGDVKLVPGCKNVSIAVTEDGSRVYMLDITRNHIVLMKKKDKSETTNEVAATKG